VGVLELSSESAAGVSGYVRLNDVAARAGCPCVPFQTINAPEIVNVVRSWRPDLLFVVGLSQLVREELLAVPRWGCVGFHPTRLPRGRGRAPVAWLVWDSPTDDGAATFFLMDAGADAGPVFVQEPFPVGPDDDAGDVVAAIEAAIDRALDAWLPRLLAGEWNPLPQDESLATWNGKRGPEDGLIDWSQPAERIHRLVRTAARPHPGAYTHVDGVKLIVWKSAVETRLPMRGTVGRVLGVDGGWVVQTGAGLLRILESEWPDGLPPRRVGVGTRLGTACGDELHRLRQRVEELERRIRRLENPPAE